MAQFSKKSSKGWQGTFSYKAPMSPTDPKWKDLVQVPTAHVTELALRAWAIDAQRVIDSCNTYEDAVKLLKTWKFGMKVRRVEQIEVPEELTQELADKLAITPEQVEALREAGIIR